MESTSFSDNEREATRVLFHGTPWFTLPLSNARDNSSRWVPFFSGVTVSRNNSAKFKQEVLFSLLYAGWKSD